MAQNFFIKIGDIEGEVTVSGFEKQIECLSWSHSFNQPTSPTRSSAGGGTVEQANHSDFSITKYLDIASVPLLKACWSGKTIDSVTFTACRSDGFSSEGSSRVKYLVVEMENVIISNISFGGGGGDVATETVTLSYSLVKYTYNKQKVKGDGTDGNMAASHDLAAQTVG